jgi:hypothetical protein
LIKIATNKRIEHTYKIYAIIASFWVDDKVVANIVKYKTQTKYTSFFNGKRIPPYTKLLAFLEGEQHEFSKAIIVDI